jgi:hypothetical protein
MGRKTMALRRDDRCSSCAAALAAGTTAQWDSTARIVTCLTCAESGREPELPGGPVTAELTKPVPESAPPPIDAGTPGASARKEYERRSAKREQRIEETWGTGRIGRIAKFLSDDPQSTTAWAKGARGEELVAQILHQRLGDTAVLLHDCKVTGTRGNIDHLAIAASGVWIIDAERCRGKVERRDVGGLFRSDQRLYVGGRDRTKTGRARHGSTTQSRRLSTALRYRSTER